MKNLHGLMIRYLLADILHFHEQIDKATGKAAVLAYERGARLRQFQRYGATIGCNVTLPARLFYGLVKNHGFIDGNKRVALHAMELYLMQNGFNLNCSQDERVAVTMQVAASQMTAEDFLTWLRSKIIERK